MSHCNFNFLNSLDFNNFYRSFQKECIQGSAIGPDLFEEAIVFLEDLEVELGGDVSAPIHEALNWGYIRFGHQAKENLYAAFFRNEDGSYWQAKLSSPIPDSKKSGFRKYESQLGGGSRAYLPPINRRIRRAIAQRYKVEVPPAGEVFWDWVEQHPEIPIVITEGGKKSLCLLSLGYVAIALYGIHGGYRTTDDQKNRIDPVLIPDLQRFAVSGREFILAFDQDVKFNTRKTVDKALTKFGGLLTQQGCTVRITQWDKSQGKGIDDFIVAQGSEAFEQVYNKALGFDYWQAKKLHSLTYPAKKTIDQDHLGDIDIPASAKLVGLLSPKGTGKTESLIKLVLRAFDEGRRVLLMTHRVQLGTAICDRIYLPYVTELKLRGEGTALGYGVCVDSMHPKSQAQFNADEWKEVLVIVDEAEQVIWHLLNSNTSVKDHRVEINNQTKQLFTNVLNSESGQIILSDADLSDVSIDFVRGLSDTKVEPWILLNKWKPENGCNVYNYETPDDCYQKLIEKIDAGEKVLVVTDSQKSRSKWSTQTLETLLKERYPALRVLRLDSEAVANPEHPAYGCVSRLNGVLKQYDIVIASPTIETGVSIDIKNHFGAVFGFLNGTLSCDSVRQFLARLRELVDRHIYVRKTGLNKIGNGSASVKSLLASQHKQTAANVGLLSQAGMEFDVAGKPISFNNTALIAWAQMAARVNAGMHAYRETVLEGLKEEGHNIVQVEKLGGDSECLKEARTKNYQRECEEIQNAERISEFEAKKLSKLKAKSKAERNKERKYELEKRYQVDVTSELIELDDKGWYPQLLMHYYLTMGREFLGARDKRAASQTIKNGQAWLPDLNQSQLGSSINFLEKLGVLQLLNPDQEWSDKSPELQRIAELAIHNQWQIRAELKITINKDSPPVTIAGQLLKKLGLNLKWLRREGPRGNRTRIYALQLPTDNRAVVFQTWSERDSQNVSTDTVSTKPVYIQNTKPVDTNFSLGDCITVSTKNGLIEDFDPVSQRYLVGWDDGSKPEWIEAKYIQPWIIDSSEVTPVLIAA